MKVDLHAEKICELALTGGVGRDARGQSGAQQPPTQHWHGGWGAGEASPPAAALHRGGGGESQAAAGQWVRPPLPGSPLAQGFWF